MLFLSDEAGLEDAEIRGKDEGVDIGRKMFSHNNIPKYAKFSNVFCGRTERGKIHEKSTGSFLLGKALCLCFVCDFQSLK